MNPVRIVSRLLHRSIVATALGFALACVTPAVSAQSTTQSTAQSTAPINVQRFDIAHNRYRAVIVDPARVDVRLRWMAPGGRPLGDLESARRQVRAEGKRFWMAMNSGIYSSRYTPLGLHVEEGQALGPLNQSSTPPPGERDGNFFLTPNGVFMIDNGRARIMETGAFARSGARPRFASQSGPILIANGRLTRAASNSVRRETTRNGVGIDGAGRVVFLIADDSVSIATFATVFREKMGCTTALYFDGSISGMIIGDERDSYSRDYVGIWTIESATVP